MKIKRSINKKRLYILISVLAVLAWAAIFAVPFIEHWQYSNEKYGCDCRKWCETPEKDPYGAKFLTAHHIEAGLLCVPKCVQAFDVIWTQYADTVRETLKTGGAVAMMGAYHNTCK